VGKNTENRHPFFSHKTRILFWLQNKYRNWFSQVAVLNQSSLSLLSGFFSSFEYTAQNLSNLCLYVGLSNKSLGQMIHLMAK
jgi:hypothetical protein